MWIKEFEGRSKAGCDRLHAVLVDVEHWSEWNDGVAATTVDGPFEVGADGVMTLPDGEELSFRIAAVDPGRGYTDETPMPGIGVVVRVIHRLEPLADQTTRIVYRCEVDGNGLEDLGPMIGQQVTSAFPRVIAALARRAEETR